MARVEREHFSDREWELFTRMHNPIHEYIWADIEAQCLQCGRIAIRSRVPSLHPPDDYISVGHCPECGEFTSMRFIVTETDAPSPRQLNQSRIQHLL